MGLISRGKTVPAGKAVPFEIYASLVDALFDDQRSLITGSVAEAACALLSAWKTHSFVLLAFAGAIALVAVLRVADMSGYWRARHGPKTGERGRPWGVSH